MNLETFVFWRSAAVRLLRRMAIVGLVALVSTATSAGAAPPVAQREASSVPIRMATPHSGFNRMLVTVTVCRPGTQDCTTIDDVMIDTGSTGLRLQAAAVPRGFRLPVLTGPDRKPMAGCIRFVSGNGWGALFRTDLHVGTAVAPALPIQIMGDVSQPVPADCPPAASAPTSNGTLGIGAQPFECGGSCEQSLSAPHAYTCDTGGCTPLRGPIDPAYRLPNPVTRFPVDNNGVTLDIAAAPPAGAPSIPGRLTFGVGTAANNGLGTAAILPLSPTGRFETDYGAIRFAGSYIDSGTETYEFDDPTMPRCRTRTLGYCVSPQQRFSALLRGIGSGAKPIPVSFVVGPYERLRDGGNGAFDNLATATKPGSDVFVWGAPFFFGRRVQVVIAGQTVQGQDATGPFYAFAPN